jgi:hypothetical protein
VDTDEWNIFWPPFNCPSNFDSACTTENMIACEIYCCVMIYLQGKDTKVPTVRDKDVNPMDMQK